MKNRLVTRVFNSCRRVSLRKEEGLATASTESFLETRVLSFRLFVGSAGPATIAERTLLFFSGCFGWSQVEVAETITSGGYIIYILI